MIPPPHGGRLVDRVLSEHEAQVRKSELDDLPRLTVDLGQAYDAEKIATGAYSPLDGFMDAATSQSVGSTLRLPSSLPWPIPVMLTPTGRENAGVIDGLRPGDEVALLTGEGQFFAILHLRSVFPLDRGAIARSVFGTTDLAHPNVAELAATGDRALAGRVDLIERVGSNDESLPELTPPESRALFERHGWKTVAGYQTRNVPHAAHEHLQRHTLERDDIDALFIHPVVGPLKPGDYRPEIVMAAYRALIDGYLPSERILLSTLRLAMRYAGPRAALWFAIVRKNYGCSHYIVGRDQAGVGRYYDPYDCHRIFQQFSVGVVPLLYDEMFVCDRCGALSSDRSCGHTPEHRQPVSQTMIRKAIAERRSLPAHLLRPEVAALLAGPEVLRGSTDPGPAAPLSHRPAERPANGNDEASSRRPAPVISALAMRG